MKKQIGVPHIAMGAALIAVCSWLSIPMTVPVTMQTFAVCLVAALFGWKAGLYAVACYIMLGAVGLPVFSGFRGGFGVLLGPTGGYIAGFLLTALAVGLSAERFGRRPGVLIPAMVLGVLLCYVFGTAWFMVVYTRANGPVSILTALSLCVFPFLLPDALKIRLAAFLTRLLAPLAGREGRQSGDESGE